MNINGNKVSMDIIEKASGELEREDVIAWGMAKYDSLGQRFVRLIKRLRGKHVISRNEFLKEWEELAMYLFPPKESNK